MTSEHLWTSERTESISRRVFPQDRPGDCTVQPSTNRNVRFATQIWLKESQVPHALPNNLKNPSCSKSPFLVSSRNRCKFAGPEVCQGRLKKKCVYGQPCEAWHSAHETFWSLKRGR